MKNFLLSILEHAFISHIEEEKPVSHVAVNTNDLFVARGKKIFVWKPTFDMPKQNNSITID